MKILKIFLILSSLLLVLNADEDKHKYKHSYKNLDYLDLTNEQAKAIKKALVELKKDYEDFYEYKEKQEDILEDII